MSRAECYEQSSIEKKRVENLLLDDIYLDKHHPIYNFLFTYFFFNHKILYQFSGGVNAPIDGVNPGLLNKHTF